MIFSKAFQRQPSGWILAEAIVLVLFIGLLDYSSGYEVSMSILYCAPIFIVAWCCEKKDGLLIALVSGTTWWWADREAGHPYFRNWMEAWETFVRVNFFLITAVGASALRQQRDATLARIALLEHSHALERQIIEISEREQQRIGQDLHDGICQYLAALSCAATSLKGDLELRQLPAEAKAAAELARLLRDAVVQTRNLARGLVPVQMDEAGLASAVEELAASVTRLLGINCSYESVGSPAVLENATAIHLYRIAQEAINNATQHGHAQNVVVSLSDDREMTTLRIADDGAGISQTEPRGGGMGLSLMHYRARLAGGELRIEEPPGGGTIVSCGIPAATERWEKDAA